MICFLHGYLLEGSGSNLWTRSVIQSLCRAGETVHIVCQEPHPEIYDFIAEFHVYHLNGQVETRFSRTVPYRGRCILHKPQIGDTLPVYVWDRYEEFRNVVPMVDLPDSAIEAYIARNVDVVTRIVQTHGITVMQANHLVLMSVVAERVSVRTGVPFVVMPHGSALEYAVKADPRFHAYATSALSSARRVLVSADELGSRVLAAFPNLPDLVKKLGEVRVGVDTSGFTPIERDARAENIATVSALLANVAADESENSKLPDCDAAAKLQSVDWSGSQTLIFVGRLIVAKGVHCIVAAMPQVLQRFPNARLIVAGHGPLRRPLEQLLDALRTGDRARAARIAEGDPEEDRLASERMDGVPEYWTALGADGHLDAYYDAAQRLLKPDTVQFVGYLTHRELQWIFPCCDVGIFPSMVKESGPMVFLEAISSGCFPIATYFAGAKDKIDTVAAHIGADAEWMKVRQTPEHLAGDLARAIPGALTVRDAHAAALRRVAEQEYDWVPIARKLATTLHAVAAETSAVAA